MYKNKGLHIHFLETIESKADAITRRTAVGWNGVGRIVGGHLNASNKIVILKTSNGSPKR